MSGIDVVRRRLRICVVNSVISVIALGWALKDCGKPCAHRLFIAARWLAPKARRFLLRRTGRLRRSRIFEFTALLTSRFSRPQHSVLLGCLIVLTLVILLDLALQSTATGTPPVVEASAIGFEPQIPSQSAVLSVSKSPMQG